MQREGLFRITLLLFAVALSARTDGARESGQIKPSTDGSTAGQAEPNNAAPSTAQQVFANRWNVLPPDRKIPKDWMDAVSDVHWIPPGTGVCDVNPCYQDDPRADCDLCQALRVPIPPNVTIKLVRCWTNAGGILGDHQISPMTCGNEDRGWSTFEPYTVDKTLGYIWQVKTVYHNRSHNRERVVALEVLFKP